MFREIGGNKVNTISFGKHGVPFVALTGVFGTWQIWLQPFELLSPDRRVIGFDHLGTGDTRVSEQSVTFENQVQLVGDLLDSFDVATCILGADSSMSAVATAAARRWPDRVDALILVSAGLDFSPPEAGTFIHGLRHAFEPTVRAFVEACLPEDREGHLREWLMSIIATTGGDRAARLLEMLTNVDIRPQLAEVSQPTLVIHGALDVIPTSTIEGAREIADRIPNARLEILPDAGHVPTLSRPETLTSKIVSFLAELG